MESSTARLDDPSTIFDAALSFAGEDREYVVGLATELVRRGYLVFYDKFFSEQLVGRDLVTVLRAVFSERSRHCIVVVSKAFGKKRWPNVVERQAILDRATRKDDGYLIPLVRDDSWLDGVPTTIGYIDARLLTAEQSAAEVAAVLGSPSNADPSERQLFEKLLFEYEFTGQFVARFRTVDRQNPFRYGGSLSQSTVRFAVELKTYGLADVEFDADEMERWVEMDLTAKGRRFRNFIRSAT